MSDDSHDFCIPCFFLISNHALYFEFSNHICSDLAALTAVPWPVDRCYYATFFEFLNHVCSGLAALTALLWIFLTAAKPLFVAGKRLQCAALSSQNVRLLQPALLQPFCSASWSHFEALQQRCTFCTGTHDICSQILWVLLYNYKVPEKSKLLHQRALLNSELESILKSATTFTATATPMITTATSLTAKAVKDFSEPDHEKQQWYVSRVV